MPTHIVPILKNLVQIGSVHSEKKSVCKGTIKKKVTSAHLIAIRHVRYFDPTTEMPRGNDTSYKIQTGALKMTGVENAIENRMK